MKISLISFDGKHQITLYGKIMLENTRVNNIEIYILNVNFMSDNLLFQKRTGYYMHAKREKKITLMST